MVYADYEYYKATYLGAAIQEAEFPRLALRASAFLDYYTQGRAALNHGLDALKMACCAVAEQYQSIESAQDLAQKAASNALSKEGGELQSQSVGSWSKTYRSAGESAEDAARAGAAAREGLSGVAGMYLAGTGLLYRGRGCCNGYVSPYSDAL